MAEKKNPHPSDPRKYVGVGGPMDGVKFRHYPDSTVTKQGKRWHFADIDIIDGTYVLEDKFARWVPSE